MKRQAIILSVLLAPGLAFAGQHEAGEKTAAQEEKSWGEEKAGEYGQEASEEYGQEASKEYGQSAQHAQAASAQDTQRIQGEVDRVDLGKGELRVKTTGEKSEKLTLRGSPDQIRQYEKGQQISVDTRKFGSDHWLTSKAAAPAAGGKTIQAKVAKVDEDTGEIELDAKPGKMSANPQDLEQIQPGQQVSVTYEEVDGQNWVSSISSQGQQGQQEGMEGMEGQMREGQEQERGMEGMDEPDPMME